MTEVPTTANGVHLSSLQPPLLTTKLYIPSTRPNRVPRPRLISRLNEGLSRKLTLISAPAGFGKTTLVTDWLHQLAGVSFSWSRDGKTAHLRGGRAVNEKFLQPTKVAWLSLDEGDNDPVRFWTYIIAALQTIQPGLGQGCLGMLHSPQPPPTEAILITLINELAALPAGFVLMLDDYHVIETKTIHESLTFLLDHLPSQMHLFLTTRVDPLLPLSRLRARGHLSELRAADLRFTPAEATTFLKDVMGLDLSDQTVAALETRTEGWIAGLQLAALAMQGISDIPGFIATFTGSHHYIIDYLADEVLQQRPDDTKEFLLQTSVLNRLCGPLCDAITGRSDGQIMLEQLQQHNLFIIPLDDERHWYRYHHLFVEVLRARLGQAHPDRVAGLQRRASLWYEQQGLLAEAVDHALASGAVEQAARLIEQIGLRVFSQGAMQYTLKKWLASLPVELVRVRPKLCLIQAWLLLTTMAPEAALQRLEEAEQALRQQATTPGDDEGDARNTQGEIAATRALTITFSHHFDPDQVNIWAQEALACLRPDNASYRGLVFGALGTAAMNQGDVVRAEQAFAEGATISRAAGHEYIALATTIHQTSMQRAGGALSRAIATCQQALTWAAERGAETTFAAGFLQVNLADLLRERNDLAAALPYAASGLACSHQEAHPYLFMAGSLALARVKQALGDLEGAFELVDQIRQLADRYPAADWVLALLPAVEAQFHLAQGDLPAALQWANSTDWAEQRPRHFLGVFHFTFAYEYGGITRAQVLIAQAWSHPSTRSEMVLVPMERVATLQDLLYDVLAYLDRQGQLATTAGLMWLRIKIYTLQALAYRALGDSAQAMARLEQALSLAEPEGYIRIFIDEGAPMAALLHQAAAYGLAPNYVSKLLVAFDFRLPIFPQGTIGSDFGLDMTEESKIQNLKSKIRNSLVEPLTSRELEVLRLIAAGQSNQEIARGLVVSVGTVKKHLNNIFGKLNATSRTQAVARARELQLL